MKQVKNALIRILEALSVILMVGITAIGTWQVLTRFLLHNPSAWSEELLTYGFAWLVFVAAALMFGKRGHMRLTFVLDHFNSSTRKAVEMLVEGISAFFALTVFVYGGYKIMNLTMAQVTPALQFSTGILYAIVPITGLCILFFCIANIVEIAQGDIVVEPEVDAEVRAAEENVARAFAPQTVEETKGEQE